MAHAAVLYQGLLATALLLARRAHVESESSEFGLEGGCALDGISLALEACGCKRGCCTGGRICNFIC